MTGVPAVKWFRRYDGQPAASRLGPLYRSVVGERTPEGLSGVEASSLMAAVRDLLSAS